MAQKLGETVNAKPSTEEMMQPSRRVCERLRGWGAPEQKGRDGWRVEGDFEDDRTRSGQPTRQVWKQNKEVVEVTAGGTSCGMPALPSD